MLVFLLTCLPSLLSVAIAVSCALLAHPLLIPEVYLRNAVQNTVLVSKARLSHIKCLAHDEAIANCDADDGHDEDEEDAYAVELLRIYSVQAAHG